MAASAESRPKSEMLSADQPKKLSQRQRERESWDAYWKVMDVETRGNPVKRMRYLVWYYMDVPVSWWREKVIEPLHDKYKWPYYHRKFGRVRSIDECPVGDQVCLYEANWQFRLDKMLDREILEILRMRKDRCDEYYYRDNRRCIHPINDFEEAELNFYIKYGDLSNFHHSMDCYMKQKHRMIWERRHPKIMEARAKAFEEHKENFKKGIYDHWFWKRDGWFQFKKHSTSVFRHENQELTLVSRENTSQDPYYHKEKQEKEARGEYMDPSDEYKPWDVYP